LRTETAVQAREERLDPARFLRSVEELERRMGVVSR
jgi:hypothetical protein